MGYISAFHPQRFPGITWPLPLLPNTGTFNLWSEVFVYPRIAINTEGLTTLRTPWHNIQRLDTCRPPQTAHEPHLLNLYNAIHITFLMWFFSSFFYFFFSFLTTGQRRAIFLPVCPKGRGVFSSWILTLMIIETIKEQHLYVSLKKFFMHMIPS